MATKIISGTYTSGYSLSTGFSKVEVTGGGSIGGSGLLTSNAASIINDGWIAAASGHNGVSMMAGGKLQNNGVVIYGGGGLYAVVPNSPGQAGGAGVALYAAGSVDNATYIEGGYGGFGSFNGTHGGAGGTGGYAIELKAGGSVANSGRILGGVGGFGGSGSLTSANGGVGGVAVDSRAGGTVTNHGGEIVGGTGGPSGAYVYAIHAYGDTGAGGAGVVLANSGLVDNIAGLIRGGHGGNCVATQFYEAQNGDHGGAGGTALILETGGTVINTGTVYGGLGGYGATGYLRGGYGGAGGDGVDLWAGGKIINTGTIWGGNGVGTGYGYGLGVYGRDGVGVSMLAGGALINGSRTDKVATIDGHDGVTTGAVGIATVTNWGTISSHAGGYAVQFSSRSDVLVVEAGCVFNGLVEGGFGTLDLAAGKGTLSGLSLGGDVTVSGSMATTTFHEFNFAQIGTNANFNLAGAGNVAAWQGLNVAGTLTVTSLNVAGQFTLSGDLGGFGHHGVGTLTLDDASASFNSGALLYVPHVSVIDGSTVAVNTNLSYAGAWTQSAGTIIVRDGATLTFTGSSDQFAGTFAGAGHVVFSGGATTMGSIDNTGVLVAQAGTVTVLGAVGGAGVWDIAGGAADFASGFSQNVDFTAATGELVLAQSQAYGGTIAGFSTTGGTSLDLGDIGFVGASEATYSGTSKGGVLTVSDGAHTAHINVTGNYRSSNWFASGDGHGGVSIIYQATPATILPPHQFIAAMAALGDSAVGAVSMTQAAATHQPLLIASRSMMA